MNIFMLLSQSWSGLCFEFSSMKELAAAFCHQNLDYFFFKSKIHYFFLFMFQARLKETCKISVDQLFVWAYPRSLQCSSVLKTICMSGSDSTVPCGCGGPLYSVYPCSQVSFLNLGLNSSLCHCQCSCSLSLSKRVKDSYRFHFLWAFMA